MVVIGPHNYDSVGINRAIKEEMSLGILMTMMLSHLFLYRVMKQTSLYSISNYYQEIRKKYDYELDLNKRFGIKICT